MDLANLACLVWNDTIFLISVVRFADLTLPFETITINQVKGKWVVSAVNIHDETITEYIVGENAAEDQLGLDDYQYILGIYDLTDMTHATNMVRYAQELGQDEFRKPSFGGDFGDSDEELDNGEPYL